LRIINEKNAKEANSAQEASFGKATEACKNTGKESANQLVVRAD